MTAVQAAVIVGFGLGVLCSIAIVFATDPSLTPRCIRCDCKCWPWQRVGPGPEFRGGVAHARCAAADMSDALDRIERWDIP